MQYTWIQHTEIFTVRDPTDLQFWSVNSWQYIKPLVGLNKVYISGVKNI
jgi:hypothetical protein